MILSKLILVISLIIASAGCLSISKYKAISNLKRYGDSQKEIENYIKKQAEAFGRLKQDCTSGQLKKGTSQHKIISLYGEPILSKPIPNDENLKELLLYRHPTQYFSTDKIYLYFDQRNNLYSWELVLTSGNN